MHKVIIANPEKCTGCGVCEMVCSASKDKAFNPRMSRIRVVKIEPMVVTALTCRLCKDAPCVASCPRKALEQSDENGVIIVDEEKCNGCGWCIESCEFGAITLHPKKRVIFACDLCEGKTPCVKFCIRDALEFAALDRVSGRARVSAVKNLFQK